MLALWQVSISLLQTQTCLKTVIPPAADRVLRLILPQRHTVYTHTCTHTVHVEAASQLLSNLCDTSSFLTTVKNSHHLGDVRNVLC